MSDWEFAGICFLCGVAILTMLMMPFEDDE